MHLIYFSNASKSYVCRQKLPFYNAPYCKGRTLLTLFFFFPAKIALYLSHSPQGLSSSLCTLFYFFCCPMIFAIPQTLCHELLYCELFCSGEMHAFVWQLSKNSRMDGRIHTLSVAALSPLNESKQIKNSPIHVDVHDVVCIKMVHLQIYVGNRGHNHAWSLFSTVQSTADQIALLHCQLWACKQKSPVLRV